MNIHKNKIYNIVSSKIGFTLVELIVVITILAILGAIAFISLQGYSSQSRDAARITDVSILKTSLELFQLNAGKYPIPTDGVDITYSGGIVWTQGNFGKTVYANVETLDKIPVDPVTDNEYTYSVIGSRIEYQLGGVMEGDEVVINPSQPSLKLGNGQLQANAGEVSASAYVTGNYNGQMVKNSSGTTCNILAIPTIITNDTTVTDLVQIVANKKFVYSGYKNLPSSFKTSKYKFNGGFDFTPNKLVAYTDSGSCSELTSTTSHTARVGLLKGLQDSYSGTILKNVGGIKSILDLTISTSSPSQEVVNYAGNFVNNSLGGNIIAGSTVASTISYPISCKAILNGGNSVGNGNYTISRPDLNGGASKLVYCDMVGGGYTWPYDTAATVGKTVLLIQSEATNYSSTFVNSVNNGTLANNNGRTRHSTDFAYFGTSSINMDTNDGVNGEKLLTVPNVVLDNNTAKDLTVDFWFKPTLVLNQYSKVFGIVHNEWNSRLTINRQYVNISVVRISCDVGGSSTYVDLPAGDPWRHIACVRYGTDVIIYSNGVEMSRASGSTQSMGGSQPLYVFGKSNLTNSGRGYFEELRVSADLARWTSNFTAPTLPYKFQ